MKRLWCLFDGHIVRTVRDQSGLDPKYYLICVRCMRVLW